MLLLVKKIINKFGLYLIVTTFALTLDAGVFLLLSKYSIFYNVINFIIAYLIAVSISFFLHQRYTFKKKYKHKNFLKYLLQLGVVFFLNVSFYQIVFYLLNDLYISKLIQLTFSFLLNYIIFLKFTFKT